MRAIRLAGWVLAASLVAAGLCALRWPAARPIPNLSAGQNRGLRNIARNDTRPPTDQQWANVLRWMKQHSPNRLAFVQSHLGRNRTQFQKAQQLIWNEYRSIQAVRYSPLRQAMVAQAEAQDQVFGAQIALREARRSGDADRQDAARDLLKAAVGKLVDGEQTVTEARIQKLQEDLTRLKKNHDRRVERIYWEKLHQAGGIRTQEAAPPPPHDDAPPPSSTRSPR